MAFGDTYDLDKNGQVKYPEPTSKKPVMPQPVVRTTPQFDYGPREDGTAKGSGFLGPQIANDGSVMTEFSITAPIRVMGGKMQEMSMPSMVPGLSKQEIDYLKTNPRPIEGMPESPIIRRIFDKARKHAQKRYDQGLPLFYEEIEGRQ
jgi:hypothetical protein